MYDCTKCRVKGNGMKFHWFAPLYLFRAFLKPRKLMELSTVLSFTKILTYQIAIYVLIDNSSNIYYFEKRFFEFRKTMKMYSRLTIWYPYLLPFRNATTLTTVIKCPNFIRMLPLQLQCLLFYCGFSLTSSNGQFYI